MRVPPLVVAVALVVSALALALWQSSASDQPETTTADERAVIDWVIDGDTVDVVIAGARERVRLIGVDAPESVSRDTPEQCFGAEASEALRGVLPSGLEVRIERDAEGRDRYGRLLLYLYRVDDGLFVNEWLVGNGFADTMFFEPNTTYRSAFTELRNRARAAGVGLWGQCEGPDQPLR